MDLKSGSSAGAPEEEVVDWSMSVLLVTHHVEEDEVVDM